MIECTCGMTYDGPPKQHSTSCAIWKLCEEEDRKRRHHDVLCLVLKELLQHDSKLLLKLPESDGLIHRSDVFRADLVDMAIKVADTAYPPPKAEP